MRCHNLPHLVTICDPSTTSNHPSSRKLDSSSRPRPFGRADEELWLLSHFASTFFLENVGSYKSGLRNLRHVFEQQFYYTVLAIFLDDNKHKTCEDPRADLIWFCVPIPPAEHPKNQNVSIKSIFASAFDIIWSRFDYFRMSSLGLSKYPFFWLQLLWLAGVRL